MTDRSSYSRQDTTSRSSRDTSSRSRPFDVTRHLSTAYDRAYTTQDGADQGFSISGYDRGHNTYDVRQSGTGYQEGLVGGGTTKNPFDFLTADEERAFRSKDEDNSASWTAAQRNSYRLYHFAQGHIKYGQSNHFIESSVDDYRKELEQKTRQDTGPSHQSDQNSRTQDIRTLVDIIYSRLGSGNTANINNESVARIRQNRLNEQEYEQAKNYLYEKYGSDAFPILSYVTERIRRGYMSH